MVKSKEEIIAATKNHIAYKYDFADGILGSRWNYAMQITHRTKNQVTMYEEVIDLLAEVIESQNILLSAKTEKMTK